MLGNLLKNGINPKWMIALVVLIDIQKGIGAGAMSLTNMIPDNWIPHVTAWNTGLAWLGVQLLGGLAALSSNAPGPLITSVPELPKVPNILKVLLAAFLLSVLLVPDPASAQGKLPKLKPLICDPANLLPGCQPAGSSGSSNGVITGTLNDLLSADSQKLAAFITKGFADAEALSTAIPDLQDGNGQACWHTIGSAASVLQQYPLTTKIAELPFDIEWVRIVNMLANKVCTSSACTQVFNEQANLINAAAPIKTNIPSISSLCASVPQIAVVAPSASASPTPVASASPSPVASNPIPSATPPLPVPSPSPSP